LQTRIHMEILDDWLLVRHLLLFRAHLRLRLDILLQQIVIEWSILVSRLRQLIQVLSLLTRG